MAADVNITGLRRLVAAHRCNVASAIQQRLRQPGGYTFAIFTRRYEPARYGRYTLRLVAPAKRNCFLGVSTQHISAT